MTPGFEGAGSAPLERARGLLESAARVVVLTGAGVSAESGVPTFRGTGGLWRSFRPEELATPEAFLRDPSLVWAWYRWRRRTVGACRPNAGHRALARWALARPGVRLLTQNVDHLHEEAAHEEAGGRDPSPALPLHLHGSLFGNRCTACGARTSTPAAEAGIVVAQAAREDPTDPESPGEAAGADPPPPRCGACGALLRPDVVWFGEALDADVLERAFAAAREAAACLLVGTSAVVHPAAALPVTTLERGGALVEVNPEPTPLTLRATVHLAGPAGQVLPDLLG